MIKPVLVTFVALLATRTAAADDLAPANPAHDEPSVALTMSPIHLVIAMAEFTAEFRVADKIGVAVIGGIGSMREQTTNERITLFEGGVSARYYVTGSFRSGIQLGAEAIYIKASTEASNIEVKAAGLGVAPFVGYKWTHRSGFTLDGQLGATYMVTRAKAETGQMAEESAIGPMLNLNVGYSF